MTEILVYQTSDPEFASKAVEKMSSEGIECFKDGRGYLSLSSGRRDLGNSICIYIRRESDYSRANEILIELGAVVDKPIQLPSRKSVVFLIGVLIAVAIFLIANSAQSRLG
ncbi:MAG: DUF2007 domain-containing protein [Solimonas sp.]